MKSIKVIILLVMMLFLQTCNYFELYDKCANTDLINDFVSFDVKVSAIFHQNVKPIPNLEIKIEIYKTACGVDGIKPGSLFTFTGFTDSRGFFDGNMVGYELRNKKDLIIVNIYYLKDNGSWFLVDHKEYDYVFFRSPINPRVLQYYFNIDYNG